MNPSESIKPRALYFAKSLREDRAMLYVDFRTGLMGYVLALQRYLISPDRHAQETTIFAATLMLLNVQYH